MKIRSSLTEIQGLKESLDRIELELKNLNERLDDHDAMFNRLLENLVKNFN
jgi:predicted  nucleic acid-binding Zn-ribbon protein